MAAKESYYERVERLEKTQQGLGFVGALFVLFSLFNMGEPLTATRLFLLPGAETRTVEVVDHEIAHTKTKGGGTMESHSLTVRAEEIGATEQQFWVAEKTYEQAIADKKLQVLRLPDDPDVMAPASEGDRYLNRLFWWAVFAVLGLGMIGVYVALGHYITHGATRSPD